MNDRVHGTDSPSVSGHLGGAHGAGAQRAGTRVVADGLSVSGFCSGSITADDEFVSAARASFIFIGTCGRTRACSPAAVLSSSQERVGDGALSMQMSTAYRSSCYSL
jgi:hypothetical protein